MKFTSKDIRLFLLTYNRPAMCEQALLSLLKQNGELDIHVIDNSDNDNTQKLISAYPQVHYHRTPNNIVFANYKAMQQLMDKPYALTLHDDDLLHPEYLELALKALNKYDDVSFIGSKNSFFYTQDVPEQYSKPAKLSGSHWLIENQADFALTFWTPVVPSWSGSIIKSEFYKLTDTESLQKEYGKISDWPMMIETMKTGKAIIFTDANCMFYRKHSAQDSHCNRTGISLEHLTNWLKLFKKFAQENDGLWGIYFLRAAKNAISNLGTYTASSEREKADNIDFLNYLADKNILTPAMLFYSKCDKNIFLKILNRPLRTYYKKDYYKKMLHKL